MDVAGGLVVGKAEKKAVKEADKQTAKELKASLEDAKTKE